MRILRDVINSRHKHPYVAIIIRMSMEIEIDRTKQEEPMTDMACKCKRSTKNNYPFIEIVRDH